ncbi:MAG: CDP-glycerol glycerophosphotransferase family protein [Firmicutes bacterium]|nr:CDP-glycerol glycerophosphotransferase family protein [Bacillota bacterium]
MITKLKEMTGKLVSKVFTLMFPIKKGKIVFTNFSGKRYGDSAALIAEELLSRKANYELVWLMLPGYKADIPKGIKRCSFSLLSRCYHLVTAHVWVDTHTKVHWTQKRDKQFYINTWHAFLPLKKVEGDAQESLSLLYMKNVKSNSKLVDIYVSGNKFVTDLYRRAFFYTGKILEVGVPRTDVLYDEEKKIEIKNKVKKFYNIADKKIVLYAPTFRADTTTDCYDLDFYIVLKALQAKFGGDWVFLIRLHPLLIKKANKFTYDDNIKNATDYDNMQELLVSADVLITDYSSSSFEFALQNKPCFLYISDYEKYKNDRNLYFKFEELPFDTGKNNAEICEAIENYSADKYLSKVNDFWKNIGCIDDGNSTKKITDIIEEYIAAE